MHLGLGQKGGTQVLENVFDVTMSDPPQEVGRTQSQRHNPRYSRFPAGNIIVTPGGYPYNWPHLDPRQKLDRKGYRHEIPGPDISDHFYHFGDNRSRLRARGTCRKRTRHRRQRSWRSHHANKNQYARQLTLRDSSGLHQLEELESGPLRRARLPGRALAQRGIHAQRGDRPRGRCLHHDLQRRRDLSVYRICQPALGPVRRRFPVFQSGQSPNRRHGNGHWAQRSGRCEIHFRQRPHRHGRITVRHHGQPQHQTDLRIPASWPGNWPGGGSVGPSGPCFASPPARTGYGSDWRGKPGRVSC